PFGLLSALLELLALLLAFGLVPGVFGLLVLRTLLLVTVGGLLIVGGLILRILVLRVLVVVSLLLGLSPSCLSSTRSLAVSLFCFSSLSSGWHSFGASSSVFNDRS